MIGHNLLLVEYLFRLFLRLFIINIIDSIMQFGLQINYTN